MSFEYIPRIRMPRSQTNSMLSLFEEQHHFIILPAMYGDSNYSAFLTTLIYLHPFGCGHPSGCEMVLI